MTSFQPSLRQPKEGAASEVIDRVRDAVRYAWETSEFAAAVADDVDDSGFEWFTDLAEQNDCEVSGPYMGHAEGPGDYFLVRHRPKPPIPQLDLFLRT